MRGLCLAAGAVAALAAYPVETQAADLGTLRAHLFYTGTGRLSKDILSDKTFQGWNTIIGEGSAEEPANDLVVTAELRSRKGKENVDTPVEIVVRGRGDRVLARRRFTGALTSAQGRTVLPVFVPDVGCAGALNITATFGKQRKTARVELNCGE